MKCTYVNCCGNQNNDVELYRGKHTHEKKERNYFISKNKLNFILKFKA